MFYLATNHQDILNKYLIKQGNALILIRDQKQLEEAKQTYFLMISLDFHLVLLLG